jgi:thimet oligopeptidase
MRLRALIAAVLAAACGASIAQAYDFPRFASAAQVEAECTTLLDAQRAGIARLETMPPQPAAAVAREADAFYQRYEDLIGPLSVVVAVHPDKALRDAADACDLRYTTFFAEAQQNAKVHAVLRAATGGDATDERLLRDVRDGFEDAGAGLPPERQARARAINTELTPLMQDFDRRVREDKTRVPFTAAELAGVPRSVWARAERDAQGRVLLGIDTPTSGPVLDRATNAAARERMWRAAMAQGGADNIATLNRITTLRLEYARLFGFDSYADFVLRRRMAGDAKAVDGFLAQVKDAVARREPKDLQLLRAAKARHLGTPLAKTVLNRWDLAFYTERERRARFRIDSARLRRHFPPQASVDWVFALSDRLFGVRFEPVQQALWHADAKAYAVHEAADGRLLGTLFLDLYPRDDKYGHAAVWSFRGSAASVGRLPAAALVTNLDRHGLSLDELETLLHEFGHALHSLLSTTRHALQAGTNTQLDYVEAPSQMLEDWVYDAGALALMQQVCRACPPVPAAEVARTERARHFLKGLVVARQHLYASYDLALHGRSVDDALAVWARMEGATPLGHVAGSMLPASFGHVATNYAAGYYGYLWSLVIAEDLRTAFAGRKLDAATGRRLRDTLLANGSQVAPAELVERFLGRPGNGEAFLRALARP